MPLENSLDTASFQDELRYELVDTIGVAMERPLTQSRCGIHSLAKTSKGRVQCYIQVDAASAGVVGLAAGLRPQDLLHLDDIVLQHGMLGQQAACPLIGLRPTQTPRYRYRYAHRHSKIHDTSAYGNCAITQDTSTV